MENGSCCHQLTLFIPDVRSQEHRAHALGVEPQVRERLFHLRRQHGCLVVALFLAENRRPHEVDRCQTAACVNELLVRIPGTIERVMS
jgi:hypothetical protein